VRTHPQPITTELGHTLIELCVVLGVAAVILVALGSVFTASQSVYTETLGSAVADDVARRALDRLVSELRFAQLDSLNPRNPTGARSLSFSTVVGWDGSVPVLSPSQTISFDSGRIVLNGNAIADQVTDLTFTLNGAALTASLALERPVMVQGVARQVVRRLVTQVRL